MTYMLLIYGVEDALTEDERKRCYAESAALTRELHAQGRYRGASPLHPVSMATSVSASRWRTAWNIAIGRPNCTRSSAC